MNENSAHVNPRVTVAQIVVNQYVAAHTVLILVSCRAARHLNAGEVAVRPSNFLVVRHAHARRDAGENSWTHQAIVFAMLHNMIDKLASACHDGNGLVEVWDGI